MFQDKPFWKMDARERIAASESKKRDGNALFKAGNFHLASKKYEKECDQLIYIAVISILHSGCKLLSN